MHRPTRQHQNLAVKLERKQTHSRRNGAKAKRWKKALAAHKELVDRVSSTDASAAD